jgi:predicted ATPase
LLTLTGPGGVGKTRLLLEYARRRQWAQDAPVLVELAGLTQGADPAHVATALGVGEGRADPL